MLLGAVEPKMDELELPAIPPPNAAEEKDWPKPEPSAAAELKGSAAEGAEEGNGEGAKEGGAGEVEKGDAPKGEG